MIDGRRCGMQYNQQPMCADSGGTREMCNSQSSRLLVLPRAGRFERFGERHDRSVI